jgi:hypothetical protein
MTLRIMFKDPADESKYVAGPEIVLKYLGKQPGCEDAYCEVNPHTPCWESKAMPRELEDQ